MKSKNIISETKKEIRSYKCECGRRAIGFVNCKPCCAKHYYIEADKYDKRSRKFKHLKNANR